MPSPARGSREGRRIVVTDDNTSKLTAVTQTLRDAGHCVFAAYDGASALELVVQLPFIDLLVTNTRLGTLDGPELMRLAREERPEMPIIHVVHDGGEEFASLPPDVFTLREPFTPEELLVAVQRLLA
jgi:CheY-like chemotaxis protein